MNKEIEENEDEQEKKIKKYLLIYFILAIW